jgi:probable F420-dependent oxidoreductase
MTYGIHVPFPGVPLGQSRPLFEEMRDLGYEEFWTAESNAEDGLTPLAMAAAWVPDVRLGTSILPVFTRGPALLAMSAATMADAAPGRFVLGLGISSEVIVQRWNGVPFVEPYKRMRDVLRFLRKAFTGERVDEEFATFAVRGFALGRAPQPPPKILVAALRPGMLHLAGREADGTILNWLSADDVRQVVAELPPGKEVVCKVLVCPQPDPEAFPREARRMVAAYLNVDVYAAYHRWLGRGELLAPMWQAWQENDRRGALAAIPDQVIDDLFVHGTPEECHAGIQRYLDNGATSVVLAVLPFGTEIREATRLVAPANRP